MSENSLNLPVCCGALFDFLGTVNYRFRLLGNVAVGDPGLWIGYKNVAGFQESEFTFCPFCSKKIEGFTGE